MRSFFYKKISAAIFFFVALAGCGNNQPGEEIKMNHVVEIYLNQPGDELLKKYPRQFAVTRYPQGINFYAADWGSVSNGGVVIGVIGHAVTLPYILSATGNDDSYFPNEHIIHWDINAGITDGDLIGHDEARHRFFNIIQSIRKAGWQRVILFSDPRLKGRDNMQYVLSESSVSYLDPDYVPNLDEWMMLGNRSIWGFYANHAYLTVTLTRDPARTDITKPGAYFIEYALNAENEEMRSYVDSLKRQSWKALLPGQLIQAKQEREKIEAVWKSKGAQIDTHYQDPPIPNLSP